MSMIEGYAASDKEERSRFSLPCVSTALESDPFQGLNKCIQILAKEQDLRGEHSWRAGGKHGFYNNKKKSGNNELMINI